MTIEQKAKAYDEALKVLHKYDGANIMFSQSLKEEMFPELKESEDEKIRKGIIRCVKGNMPDNDFRKEYIAWLEKQGEHKKFCDSIQIGDKVTRNEDGVLVNLSQLKRVAKKDEKQGEQKPTYTKEYDFHGMKFIPKFAKGDIIKDKKRDEVTTIEDFSYDTGLYTHTYGQFPITIQDNYEIIEQKTADKSDVLMSLDEAIAHCKEKSCGDNACALEHKQLEKWLTELKKLKEQKSVDKVEPKFKVKYAGSEYNVFDIKDIASVTFYGIEDEPNHIDYVQAENCERVDGYSIKENDFSVPTKPIMFSEQKPAWSEEDKMFVHGLIRGLAAKRDIHGHTTFSSDCIDITRTISWLKSLKDRVQPKQEWSEEDKKVLHAIRNALNYEKPRNYLKSRDFEFTDILDWLKSLRPQNRWKPSEEEMKVLEYSTRLFSDTERGNYYSGVLEDLYEELKKLREE